jgi:hypothetical protein
MLASTGNSLPPVSDRTLLIDDSLLGSKILAPFCRQAVKSIGVERMIEAEEARLKAEIDGIVENIKTTMQKIESVIPTDDSPEAPDGEDSAGNRFLPA